MSNLIVSGADEQRIVEARKKFFERDADPQSLVAQPILESWRRCKEAGLDTGAGRDIDPEGRSQLLVARERSETLLDNASGVMEHLFEQIRASGSVVLLADNQGMILHCLGDPSFVTKAQRVALQPGAVWSETVRGTNAVGTALAAGEAVEVLGAEHFLDRNSILSCSAVPIFNPDGQIAGILDISSDSRSDQRHTLGLVRIATQLLEKRLFEIEHGRHILIAVHSRPECIGGMQEGLIAVSTDAQVVGANPIARAILKDLPPHRGETDFSSIFRLSFGSFMDRSRRDPHSLHAIEARNGDRLFVRLRATVAMPEGKAAERPLPRAANSARESLRDKPCNRRQGIITLDCLATGDPRLQFALDRAARISNKDIPLLIQGESGVGKELFARAFHFSGTRRDGPFVALNCAAIPENLIESELFGYVGGAFTGARREGATGRIQQAHGGTLFLDEIGDMPLGMQARLLRVLQERSVTPIGGQSQIPVNISLVCATHHVLREAVKNGSFREDLYYRVNGLTVTIPPLRERTDTRCIATAILKDELADSAHEGEVVFSAQVLDFIDRYPWPGNIRQLQNVIRVATALLDDDENVILPIHLPEELFATDPMDDMESGKVADSAPPPLAVAALAPPGTDTRSLDEIELEAIATVMEAVGGNVSAAARQLGISRNTLYRKMGRMR